VRQGVSSFAHRLQYRFIYWMAGEPGGLPWHRDEPPPMVQQCVAARSAPGSALYVGCGAGVHAVWLAQRGWRVIGVDFTDSALEMARARVQAAGLDVELRSADVTRPTLRGEAFDLVLDAGCLHSFAGMAARRAYRENLMAWLAPGADYLLWHAERRHRLDWRPVGPRRLPSADISGQFLPDLALRQQTSSIERTALPIGPTLQLGSYWFRRPA